MTLSAVADDYTRVVLTFDVSDRNTDTLYGTATEYRLLQNPLGLPASILDGYTVATLLAPLTGSQRVVVSDLTPGRWVYFTLFARYTVTVTHGGDGGFSTIRFGSSSQTSEIDTIVRWVPVETAGVLVPADYGYKDRLWRMIPEWYRRLDFEEGNGGLQHLIDALGFEVDTQRTWASTLGDARDAERVSSFLLPHLGDLLGAPYEVAAGERRYRSYLNQLMHLRRIKGTARSIEGAIETVTGFRTITYVGKNILLSSDDSDLRDGIGNWVSTNSIRLARVTSSGVSGEPTSGKSYITLQRSGTDTTAYVLYGGGFRNRAKATVGVPAEAGHSYRFSLTMGSTGNDLSTGRVGLAWRDATHAGLSTTLSDTATLSNVTAGGTYSTLTTGWVVAPAGTVFVAPYFDGSVPSDGELRAFDFMLSDKAWQYEGMPGRYDPNGPSLTHEVARLLHVNVYPQRANYAINSDFAQTHLDVGAVTSLPTPSPQDVGYLGGEPFGSRRVQTVSGEATATLAINTTTRQATLTSVSTTSPRRSQVFWNLFPVTADLLYSAALEIQSTAVYNTHARLRFLWYANGTTPNEISGSGGASEAYPLTLDWRRIIVLSATPPAQAAWGRLVLETTNTVAHAERIRKVLIEDRSVIGTYFDGDSTDGNVGDYAWVGQPHSSFSVYHQNYLAMLNAPGETDRAHTIAREYAPFSRDILLHTAANGLL